MLKQKLICCVLAASLVAGCAVPALGDTQADIAYAKAEEQSAATRLDQTRSKIEELEAEKLNLESDLSNLNGRMESLT